MISFLIEGGKVLGGDVGKAGSAVEATGGGTRADGASDLRQVEGVGARLELRRALLGLAGRRVFLKAVNHKKRLTRGARDGIICLGRSRAVCRGPLTSFPSMG